MVNYATDLMHLPGRTEELAWIKERLQTMSTMEEAILGAAIMRKPPQSAADTINHILTLDYYGVCVGADSYEALGEFYLSHELGKKLPQEAMPFVDLYFLGINYENSHPGLFVGNCFVECPSQEFTPLYDGVRLPEEDYSWSLRLKLASPNHPEGVWLKLPDYQDMLEKPDEIEMAFQKLGVDFNCECTLLDVRCSLPGITGLKDYDSLDDLIRDGQNLGYILSEQGEGDPDFMRKFLSALEYEGCTDLKLALDISQNLHCYDFVPADKLYEHGEKLLKEEIPDLDELVAPGGIDFEGYAKSILEKEGAVLTQGGQMYIKRNSHTFVTEFAQLPPDMMTMS